MWRLIGVKCDGQKNKHTDQQNLTIFVFQAYFRGSFSFMGLRILWLDRLKLAELVNSAFNNFPLIPTLEIKVREPEAPWSDLTKGKTNEIDFILTHQHHTLLLHVKM